MSDQSEGGPLFRFTVRHSVKFEDFTGTVTRPTCELCGEWIYAETESSGIHKIE